MLSVNEALRAIEEKIGVIDGTELHPLKNCSGKILAKAACAGAAVPADRISAMDGYALNTGELGPGPEQKLVRSGTSWAGRPYTGPHRNGECIRIYTGAVVPDWADAVIIQENITADKDRIIFSRPVSAGEHIREAGSDIRRGQTVLNAGHRISAADIGILASLGISELCVRRRLRAAFFSTGDELRPINSTLKSGEIFDSNRYSLHALLAGMNIHADDLGVVPDNPDTLQKILQQSADQYDVLISSGGVSAGDADYTRPAVDAAGSIEFWKIAMKPGKPLAFGRIRNCWFFGLPGNPVSVIVTFYQIVRPALRKLMGANPRKRILLTARCSSEIRRQPGRQEFQRGYCFTDDCGTLVAQPAGKQQSHQLSALGNSNCFIILPAECSHVASGADVQIELIEAPYSFC